MRIQSCQGHDQGPCLFLGFFLDENILEHMAKGNIVLLVEDYLVEMKELVEDNVQADQAERKMVDMEMRMIQVHMVMVKVPKNMVEFHKEILQGSLDLEILFKTGNVRDCHPFITLILGPKIFGMRMLEIWTVNDKNRSELLSRR
ncbi:hypothetical protein WN943_010837 [Citrus x changshan-huyou]